MKRSSFAFVSVVFASLVLNLPVASSVAQASGIDLHQIYPAQNTRFMTVESPTLSPVDEDMAYLPELGSDYGKYYRDYYERLFVQLDADLVINPLVADDNKGNRLNKIVDSLSTLDFSLGYQFNPRIAIFGETSFSRSSIDSVSGIPNAGSSKTVMGDSRVLVKWLLNPPNDENRSFTFALIPEIDLPTGNTDYFTSNGFGYGLNLSAEKEWGKFSLSGNFGIRLAPDAIYGAIDYREQLPYALGALFRFNDSWGVVGEFSGAFALASNDFQNHAEVFLGPRWRESRDWTLLAAIGTGHFKSDNSDDFRAIVQVKYTPFKSPVAPPPAPVATPTPTPAPIVKHQSETFCPLESVTFANNSTVLTEKAKQQIRDFAKRAQDVNALPKITVIQIQGHASPVGPIDKNQILSEDRAGVSKDFLVALGVPELKVETRAYSQLAAPRGNFKTRKEKLDAWRRAEFFCEYEK